MSEAKVAKLSKSSKGFLITCNEEIKFGDVLNYIRSLNPCYFVASKEKAPSTGHIHMHCYCQFPNARRLSLTKLQGSHVDKCYGSPQQNEAYVKKDGDIIAEEGEIKKKGGKTIKEVKEMNKEQRAELPIQYYKIIEKINSEENKRIKVDDYYKEREVYWFYGPSGLGKTKRAVELLKKRNIEEFNEVKYDGQFWHGVEEECEVCIYDDWRDSHMKPTELINFIDYNTHIMNVKGGSVRNKYKLIIITSIQDPEKIYMNTPEEYKRQWLRRIKEIDKFTDVTE